MTGNGVFRWNDELRWSDERSLDQSTLSIFCQSCRGLIDEASQLTRIIGDGGRTSQRQLLAAAEPPQHTKTAHPIRHRAFHIETAIADHHRVLRRRLEISQRGGDHRRLLAMRIAWLRAI